MSFVKRQKIMLPSHDVDTPNYDFMKKYVIIEEMKQIQMIIEYYNKIKE